VLLCPAVQREAGLVEQEDKVALRALLELVEVGQEAEEPDEAAGPVVERDRDAMAVVADPDLQDRTFVERRRGAGFGLEDAEQDSQVGVLGPVLEDLLADRVAGVLQLADEALVVV